jgi:mannan endo-1,4-beta-mannosidase
MNVKSLGCAVLALVVLLALTLARNSEAAGSAASSGLHVREGRLVEAEGSILVLRGINHPHAWYPQHTHAFADIKSTGANAIRVVLSTQTHYPSSLGDVTRVVSLCREHRLICVLENHDTTGYSDKDRSIGLLEAVKFWIMVKSSLVGHENYVIINVGNEPFARGGESRWTTATTEAIKQLRSAGFSHAIMVDAPNWGQDNSFAMRDSAQTVFEADRNKNVLFSVHMYGAFDNRSKVKAYVDYFANQKLPLVIGEFGHLHSHGTPDVDSIMAYAQEKDIGYLAWSWSGNTGGVEYLDLVTGFDATKYTQWGKRLIGGANGIRATSREAAIFRAENAVGARAPISKAK